MTDFTKGRWMAYGYGPNKPLLGYVDGDEFVRSFSGSLLFRIDGADVYNMQGAFVGTIDNQGLAMGRDGSMLFNLQPD